MSNTDKIEYPTVNPENVRKGLNWFSKIPRKYRVLGIITLLAAAITVSLLVFGAGGPGEAELRLNPQGTTNISVGETVKVGLDVIPGQNEIVGSVEASVRYDPDKFSINCQSVSSCNGVDVNVDASVTSPLNEFNIGGLLEVNPSSGVIRIVVGATSPGIQSTTNVATFTFSAINEETQGTDIFVTNASNVLTLSDNPTKLTTTFGKVTYTISPTQLTCEERGGFPCAESECQAAQDPYALPITGKVCCTQNCSVPNWQVVDVSHQIFNERDTMSDVRITWETRKDGATTSAGGCRVEYRSSTGTTQSKPSISIGPLYSVDLKNLQNDRYYYKIICPKSDIPPIHPIINSKEYSFRVGKEPDPLSISGLAAINIKSTSADIIWETNIPASSLVMYTLSSCPTYNGSCGVKSVVSPGDTKLHKVGMTGLTPNTQYFLRAFSKKGTDEALSGEINFWTTSGTLEPDSNIILKVQGDRKCTEWLTCSSAARVLSDSNKVEEELCFERGLCREFDSDGKCAKPVDVSGTASGYKSVYGNKAKSTVDSLRNRSGYFKPTFEWKGFPSLKKDKTVYGWQHIGNMDQVGQTVNVRNGDLETFRLGDDIESEVGVYPWKVFPNGATTTIALARSAFENNEKNQVLEVVGRVKECNGCDREVGGIMVPLGNGLNHGDEYVASFDYNISPEEGATLQGWEALSIRIYNGRNFTFLSDKKDMQLAGKYGSWQHATARLKIDNEAPLEQSWLVIFYYGDSGPNSAYRMKIDNVTIDPVLEIRPGTFVEKKCRIYPGEIATQCDYTDRTSKKQHKGWKGYCLEQDPKNQGHCLLWWPVDLVRGESSLFTKESITGYKDRFPLYYCLESAGNQESRVELKGKSERYQIYVPYYKNIHKKCDKSAPSGIDYTFSHCSRDVYGKYWEANASDKNINEYEIERVHIKKIWGHKSRYVDNLIFTPEKMEKQATEEYDKRLYIYDRIVNGSFRGKQSPIIWKVTIGGEDDPPQKSANDKNYIHVALHFDNNGKFKAYQVVGTDGNGKGEGAAYKVIFYLKETCNYIAQTVTPFGENKAWTARFQNQSWLDHNPLEYGYNDDYVPYGGAITEKGLPNEWNLPIAVEPMDELNFPNFPHQARAGSPYSVELKESLLYICLSNDINYPINGKVCSGPNAQLECLSGTPPGICQGGPNHGTSCANVSGPCEGGGTCGEVSPVCSNNKCEYGVANNPIITDTELCFDTNGDGIYDNAQANINAECGGGICKDRAEWITPDPAYVCAGSDTGQDGQPCDPTVQSPCGFTGSCNLVSPDPQCTNGYCDEQTECVECEKDTDCKPNVVIQGTCEPFSVGTQQNIGTAFCVGGSSNKIGQTCETSSDCGLSLSGAKGKCVGINMSDTQRQRIEGGVRKGVSRLQYLFAKSYGIWKLQRDATKDEYHYTLLKDSGIADPMAFQCGDIGTFADAGTNQCGWDITSKGICEGGSNHGQTCDPYTAGQCQGGGICVPFATKPEVKNLYIDTDLVKWSEDKNSILSITPQRIEHTNGFATVVLFFNSSVDDNQLPLVRYTIDWDDGTKNSVSNLRISDKEDPKKPHALVHTYTCAGPDSPGWVSNADGDACIYKPRVQLEDNWGWCSGNIKPDGTANPDNYSGDGTRCNSWTEYGEQIVVVPQGYTPPPPPNKPPVAQISVTPPTSGFAPLTVQFDGTGSSDPDGTIAGYVWDFDDGLTSPDPSPSHTFSSVRSYNITLIVTDDDGDSSQPASTAVTVNPNVGPIINGFVVEQTGDSPMTVDYNFEIIESTRGNDFPVNIDLDYYGDGSIVDSFTLNADGNITKRFIYTKSGNWNPKVTATDSSATPESTTATTFVTVYSSPNDPTNLTQSLGTEGVISVQNNTPSFSFTISDVDIGQIIGYQIQISTNSGFTNLVEDYTWPGSTTNPNNVTFDVLPQNSLPNGDYWWRVRGTDERGKFSTWRYFGDINTADFTISLPAFMTGYKYRQQITVTNNESITLPAPFPVQIGGTAGFNTAALVGSTPSKMLSSMDDLLIVYDNGSTYEKVERYIINPDSANTYIWFRTQADIPSSGTSNAYWLYYGNSSAPTAPNLPSLVMIPENIPGETVALYHFEETGGSTLVDISGSNNGTLVGNPTWGAGGRFGRAIEFDGNGDYVDLGNPSSFNLSKGTIEFWIKHNATPGFEGYFSKDENGQTSPGHITVHSDTNKFINYRLQEQEPGLSENLVSDNTIDSNWHHIAVTFGNDYSNQLYIDGVLKGTGSIDLGIVGNPSALFLGAIKWVGPAEKFLTGRMDGFRISNRQLTSFPYAKIKNDPSAVAGSEQQIAYNRSDVRVAGVRIHRLSFNMYNPLEPLIDAFRYIFGVK